MLHLFERAYAKAFAAASPWQHFGALGFFLFWVITATGIYVYAYFDTSVDGAYRSVERLTRDQWYLGGVMRSLHRYASDAFVIVMALHLFKEFCRGHFRGFRWFSWVSGIALIWLTYASGIGGYWLVWDQLAQFSITATAEWLDCLPFIAGAIVRNFTGQIDDRFFSLLIFLHIGIPLLLLALMWLHIQRISRADIMPPKSLALGTLATLTLLALFMPAVSHPPAKSESVATLLHIDWFYLFVHPLQYATSPEALWAIAALATMGLALLPVVVRAPQTPRAMVSPANCNGCGRCVADCPYAAIMLAAHPSRCRGQKIAIVSTDLCASCGICAGACPSSTPFRSSDALISGIDMPGRTIAELRAGLERGLAAEKTRSSIVVFGCDHGADIRVLGDAQTITIGLYCIAMLPPSFIEYALRAGATGVLIASCHPGECEFRLGVRWIKERIAGVRAPGLRSNVPAERLGVVYAGKGEEGLLHIERDRLKKRFAGAGKLRLPSASRLLRRRDLQAPKSS